MITSAAMMNSASLTNCIKPLIGRWLPVGVCWYSDSQRRQRAVDRHHHEQHHQRLRHVADQRARRARTGRAPAPCRTGSPPSAPAAPASETRHAGTAHRPSSRSVRAGNRAASPAAAPAGSARRPATPPPADTSSAQSQAPSRAAARARDIESMPLAFFRAFTAAARHARCSRRPHLRPTHRAGLGQLQAYPAHAELLANDRRAALGQRFDQAEAGTRHVVDQPLRHVLVIQRSAMSSLAAGIVLSNAISISNDSVWRTRRSQS